MKKFYTLLLGASVALSVNAQSFVQLNDNLAGSLNGRKINTAELQPVSIVEGDAPQVIVKNATVNNPAPSTLVGKSYVVYYYDGDTKCNGYFTGEQDSATGNIIFKGLGAGTDDLTGTYDAASGTITIPANGAVIGTNSTYGDIQLFAGDEDLNLYRAPITGTWDGEKFVFDYSFITTVIVKNDEGNDTYGLWFVMDKVTTAEPNANITFRQVTTSGILNYNYPLIVSKSAENQISVIGLSTIKNGFYYEVPFTIDESAKTATLPFGTTVTEAYYNQKYVECTMGGISSQGGLVDLVMSAATTDNSTTLSTSSFFIGFPTDTQGNYSGWAFQQSNCRINVDYNIFTAPVGTSVDDITIDNNADAPVEYYNLQGVKLSNPAAGQIVIRRQGTKVTKIIAQ